MKVVRQSRIGRKIYLKIRKSLLEGTCKRIVKPVQSNLTLRELFVRANLSLKVKFLLKSSLLKLKFSTQVNYLSTWMNEVYQSTTFLQQIQHYKIDMKMTFQCHLKFVSFFMSMKSKKFLMNPGKQTSHLMTFCFHELDLTL